MDPVSPIPAVAALLVAFATSAMLARLFGAPPDQGRFASIDGLRGYLAFFVFLHHSSIWYFYLRTAKWELPPSNLYSHLGESSVGLFFMITGFLFFSKLIDGRTRNIDWAKLFISRLLRLGPLYLILMLVCFLLVAYLSNGVLTEPVPKLVKGMIKWIGFRMLGAPTLNGVSQMSTFAGVTWSLPYEWFFYLSLPVFALAVGAKVSRAYVALGIASLCLLAVSDLKTFHLASFLGGIAAAFLVRSDSFRRIAVRGSSSVMALACMGTAVAFFPSAYGLVPLLLLSAAFALIASGNTLFGILANPASRFLGELAYGIYLLHSVPLFMVFNFILGPTASRSLSAESHWLVVAGITPFLVCLCFLTFRLIERPAMRSTTNVTEWLRSRFVPGTPTLAPNSKPPP